MNESTQTEASGQPALPLYRSHKLVRALKIKAIETLPTIDELDRILNEQAVDGDGIGGTITPEEAGYRSFTVSHGYISKHSPKVGGYFVVYEDGYQSFSPAAPFESGYYPCPDPKLITCSPIATGWQSYLNNVVNPANSPDQIAEMRRVFYAGAMIAFVTSRAIG